MDTVWVKHFKYDKVWIATTKSLGMAVAFSDGVYFWEVRKEGIDLPAYGSSRTLFDSQLAAEMAARNLLLNGSGGN